jgi:hypothetical protein
VKRLVAACILVTFVALGVAFKKSAEAVETRERTAFVADSLQDVVDAALHDRDVQKALRAQDEMRWKAQNDSLRRVVLHAQNRPLLTSSDTVSFIRYVYDTVLPECQRCAERSDTVIADDRVERADSNAIRDLQSQVDWYKRLRNPPQPRSFIYADFLHNPFTKENALAAGADFRLFGEVRALARIERRMVRGDTTRLWIGARVRIQ